MLTRRRFLGATLATATLAPLATLLGRPAWAHAYGPLVPDPEGILDLPEGFSYRVVQRLGDRMTDGHVVPGEPDGMWCFTGPDGRWVLMRNHEVDRPVHHSAYPADQTPGEAYAQGRYGGVTRVVIDPQTGDVVSSNLVLAGTCRNCAGGPSPWGWISCEESIEPGHGYAFLCPIDATSVQAPIRIPGYGRFHHEAAAIDPDTAIAWLTEDRVQGAFYRFVPHDPAVPFVGRLQALRAVDTVGFDTATEMSPGDRIACAWVDLTDPEPPEDNPGTRHEAFELGALRIKRGEGITLSDGIVWICSTTGGPVEGGQIFRLFDGTTDTPTLELVAQSTSLDRLDMPDNVVMAPWGQLFMCEDGRGGNGLRGLTADGEVFDFAVNRLSGSELAGACFSPDGRAMFVNVQHNHLTLMIEGPFPDVSPASTWTATACPSLEGTSDARLVLDEE